MKKELKNIKAIMDLFFSQNGEFVNWESIEWELDFRTHLLFEIEKAFAEQREELGKKLAKRIEDMIKNPLLTQHGERAGIKAELDSLKRFIFSLLTPYIKIEKRSKSKKVGK